MKANRTCVVLAAALLGLSVSAGARQGAAHIELGGMRLFVPAGSPVHIASRQKAQPFAKFAGRFTIAGHYSIQCDDFVADPCAPESLELYIEPDAALLARLPRWDMYRDNRPLIEIEEAQAFIKAYLDAPTLAAFRRGSIQQKTGYTSIVVENLSTGVDCDSPWYIARLVSFAPPAQVAARAPDGNPGCG